MGTADPETVCQASDADGTCSVPAEGTWDQDYASWTVTVTDGEGNGLSADATTDSLHLLLASYAKEVTDEDPSPFGQGQLEFFLPYGVAVDGSSVHVAEQSNNRLHSFSDSGVFLGFVGALGGGTGASGSGDGEFDAPHDVTVGPSGNLYIADHSNARVQVLDGTTRQPLFSFGSLGTGDGQLRFPVSLAFDGLDQLHVAESVNARVSMYDAEGNFLSTYSSGAEPFVSPTRIAWLPEIGAMAISDLDVVHIVPVGDAEAATWEVIDDATAVASGLCPVGWGETLVTLDDPSETVGSVGHTVVRLDADGAVVSSFGAWGVGEGDFWRPVDCAVDEVGDIWVADGLNHRIQVFGP